MRAEVTEQFLLLDPKAQQVMIQMQREMDDLEAQLRLTDEKHEKRRQEVLKHIPRWRKVIMQVSWWAYYTAIPKWARV